MQPQGRDVPGVTALQINLPEGGAQNTLTKIKQNHLKPFLAEGSSCKRDGRVASKARGKTSASVFPIAGR